MSRGLPPSPHQFRSIEQWAVEFYDFFLAQSRIVQENDPLPILLPHRTRSIMERAAVAGVLLYDATYETPVVSIGNAWEPLRTVTEFLLCYDTAAAVAGAAVGTGGVKVPFNVAEVSVAPWATFNAGTTDFTLARGTYQVQGHVTLTKSTGTGARNFAGYLAQSTDLTTPVGTVKMGSLHIPSGAPAQSTHVAPFRGQVTVPDGGGTYAMVVNTPDIDSQFGIAHGIIGYDNVYARLEVSLVGLNE